MSCVKVKKKSDDAIEANPAASEQNPPVIEKAPAEPIPEPVIVRISENMNLITDSEFVADEIYIQSNVRIYTNQFSLKLKAQKIFFGSDSVISNFSIEHINAPFMQKALNGGMIEILSEGVYGKLKIELNAQNGSYGIGGWTTSYFDYGTGSTIAGISCTAGNGLNGGKSGSLSISVNESEDFYLITNMKLSSGGAAGITKDLSVIQQNEKPFYRTDQDPGCHSKAPAVRGSDGEAGVVCKKMKKGESPLCI